MKGQSILLALSAGPDLLLLAVSLAGRVYGQSGAGPVQGTAGAQSQDGVANPDGVDPGSVDKLLDLVDKDMGQLGQVSVAKSTGSPSLDQPVSTVDRQASTVGKSPAAVFVITNEMIRRSGAVCIPDVLRMVPGISVAQISTDEWAISARGFNFQYANKLLVQIDGRTVYDLMYGGVVWEVQDVILEDVERIEVIRGPGATVWGANAVNGVINIITKKAQDTQGLLIQEGAGTHELGFTNARAGGRIGQDLYYRFYGKWFDRGPSFMQDGETLPDRWQQARSGFRMDYDAGKSDAMTLQGDYYDGNIVDRMGGTIPTPPYFVTTNAGHVTGENILYRWSHIIDDRSDWTFQTYYDRTQRHQTYPQYGRDRDLMDFDFQHRFPLGTRNEVIWGCGYRFTQDSFENSPFYINILPQTRFDNYFSYFLQDQIALAPDRWFFTAGSKFEHNNYTNFEYQPTARLLWTPTERHSIWGSISRTVHVPTRYDEDFDIRIKPIGDTPPPLSMPIFPLVSGNRGLQSEDLMAYEFGIRVQSTPKFSWDLATFFNKYNNIFSVQPGEIQFEPPAYMIFPMTFVNGATAESYGIELATNYVVNEYWRMQCAYTYFRLFVQSDPTLLQFGNLQDAPVNQVYLQSSWDVGNHWQFDLIGRYVDSLNESMVPRYIVMDTRLAWHSGKSLEVAVVGRNLLNGYYPEYSGAFAGVEAAEVGPQVYGQVTWRY